MFFMYHPGDVTNEVAHQPAQRTCRQCFVAGRNADKCRWNSGDTTEGEDIAEIPCRLRSLPQILKDFFTFLVQDFAAGTPALYSGPANFQLSISEYQPLPCQAQPKD